MPRRPRERELAQSVALAKLCTIGLFLALRIGICEAIHDPGSGRADELVSILFRF